MNSLCLTKVTFLCSSLYFDLLAVTHSPSSVSCAFGSPLSLFFHSLLPSVSFVNAAVLQSQDACQTFRPNGRQLIIHIEAKL